LAYSPAKNIKADCRAQQQYTLKTLDYVASLPDCLAFQAVPISDFMFKMVAGLRKLMAE
jgi:hypothetical protein